MLKEHISFINGLATITTVTSDKEQKLKKSINSMNMWKEIIASQKSLYINSKGVTFKEKRFQTSFARISCINLSHFIGFIGA